MLTFIRGGPFHFWGYIIVEKKFRKNSYKNFRITSSRALIKIEVVLAYSKQ